MNFDELKQLVDDRVGHIDARNQIYNSWAEILKKLQITGFTVVIVYDKSIGQDEHEQPIELDHVLIWQSVNKKNSKGDNASRFWVGNIVTEDCEMRKIFLWPIGELKLEQKEQFFSVINDDEVEKIIKNCIKINPIGFHYINTVSDTNSNNGTPGYINRAIERYEEYRKNQSIKARR